MLRVKGEYKTSFGKTFAQPEQIENSVSVVSMVVEVCSRVILIYGIVARAFSTAIWKWVAALIYKVIKFLRMAF